jgi:hypothetical protein
VINAGMYVKSKLADCEHCNAMDGHLEKLMAAQIISRFPTFYGIQKFLVYWSLPLAALMPQFNHIHASDELYIKMNCIPCII